MILTTFDGFTLPTKQHVSDIPIEALTEYLRPTGAQAGEYDLYGSQSPFANQAYRAEFIFTGGAAMQSDLDTLKSKVGKRGTLTKTEWDATTRQTEAKLLKASMVSNPDDAGAGIQRVSCDFISDPLWYAGTATVVSFTSATSADLTGNDGNLGGQRAIRYVVLTITDSVTASVGSPFTIAITPTSGTTATFLLEDDMSAPIVIDAGSHTVTEQGGNVYAKTSRSPTQLPLLFIEPGNSVLTFSSAVSGQISFRSCYK